MGFESSLCKLSELAHVNPRRAVTKGIEVPFIDMAALPLNGRDISPPDIRARLAKGSGARFQDGDTLVARITPCLENGKTAQVKGLGEGVVAEGSTEFIVLCGKSPLDNAFIYYLSRSPEFREFAISRMEGTSGRQRVVWQAIANYEFSLPPEDARRAAAEFLSIIDDRIEVLRQANVTLEAIAQALFKSWFVDFDPVRAKAEGRAPEEMDAATAALFPADFERSELGDIPKGWRVASLQEHITAERGLSYKGTGLAEDGVPMHNLNSVLEGGGYKYSGIKYYRGDYKDRHIAQPGDIIVANTEQGHHHRLIGFPAVVPRSFETGIYSHHLYRVRIQEHSGLTPEWLYQCLMASAVSDQIIGCANGSTVNMLKPAGLQIPRFAVPSGELCAAFDAIANPIREIAEANVARIGNLSALRDILLPRLISGKLRLPDAEVENEAAFT